MSITFQFSKIESKHLTFSPPVLFCQPKTTPAEVSGQGCRLQIPMSQLLADSLALRCTFSQALWHPPNFPGSPLPQSCHPPCCMYILSSYYVVFPRYTSLVSRLPKNNYFPVALFPHLEKMYNVCLPRQQGRSIREICQTSAYSGAMINIHPPSGFGELGQLP